VLGNGSDNIVQTYEYGAPIKPPADPTRKNYKFTGWSPSIPPTMPAGNISVTAQWESDISCIAAGTLIMMADGTQKPVEEIQPGDYVLAFNHESGQIESVKIQYNDHSLIEWKYYDVINLEFSNGIVLKIIGEHAIYNVSRKEYSHINANNAYSYIGDTFYSIQIISEESMREDVILTNANCISKSWPSFYTQIKEAGGRLYEL
jgi:hypothetical protein